MASWSDQWGTALEKSSLKDNPERAGRLVRALTPWRNMSPTPPEEWFTTYEKEHENGEVQEVQIIPGLAELIEVMRQAASHEGGWPDPEVAGMLISQVLGGNTGLLLGGAPAVE